MILLVLKLLFYIFVLIVISGCLLKVYYILTMGRYKIRQSLKGKVVVITGGTAGIGKETVRELARHEATIHILARDLDKAERVVGEIRRSTGNDRLRIHQVDLCRLETIRRFAQAFDERRVHILINNAGLASSAYRKTIDGNEETTQANHLGHFLLTNLLLDRLIAAGQDDATDGHARIVNVSSIAHRFVRPERFDPTDINFDKTTNPWQGFKAYCWSKLMNVLFTKELARRLRGTNVTVNSLHPGGVRTEISRERSWKTNPVVFGIWLAGPFLKSAKEGANTTLYLATSPDVRHVSGHYFTDCQPDYINLLGADDRLAKTLWDESKRLTKSA